jgi:hypothetical protein
MRNIYCRLSPPSEAPATQLLEILANLEKHSTSTTSARGAMRGSSILIKAARYHRPVRIRPALRLQYRAIQISATPTAESPIIGGDIINSSIDPSLDPAGKDPL